MPLVACIPAESGMARKCIGMHKNRISFPVI